MTKRGGSGSRATAAMAALWFLLLVSPGTLVSQVQAASDSGNEGPVIGIDLGTTYSCVGVYSKGQVDIIANDLGNRITPSFVAFTPEGRLVGDPAKNQLTSNPDNTVFDVKRLMGRTWDDPVVQQDMKNYPFKVVNTHNRPSIEVSVGGEIKRFTPEEISAMVLSKMRQVAEDYLGQNVTRAVVTVPAYFNDAQRRATEDAGRIAGLQVLRILNEPTAASLAYGLEQKGDERTVLVFDLGGGTFDVSVLTVDNGVFEVLATAGDTHLGGEDFDQRLVNYLVKVIKQKTGEDVRGNKRAMTRLRRSAEQAKRALSSQHSTRVDLEGVTRDLVDLPFTRAKFEELNMDLFRSTLKTVQQAITDSGKSVEEIEDIVLVGGSTRIPRVQSLVKEFFGGKEPHRGIHPDEAVAFGAAVQAAVLSGQKMADDVLIVDVSALSLGLETVGGVMTSLVPRGTTIPVHKAKVFSTATDNQNAVTIQVYEGERSRAKDNHLLGRFDLTGIPPAPRGVPQIEVTFQVDANGVLRVSAEDKGTGQKNDITIERSGAGLSPEDVERMVKEAEDFAQEDKHFRELTDARNGLESMAYTAQRQLDDLLQKSSSERAGDVSEEDLDKAKEAVRETIEWLESNPGASVEDIEEKKRGLESVLHPVAEALYSLGLHTAPGDRRRIDRHMTVQSCD
ncbi:endoplasmic reticulum chaperone BiP-like [Babylonia areolata]|uniref:endoplasmic reticulum chaperone BiP-like n=1 Tax=Babylonia areolata TaxID=304850 RepID=UPI003FCF1DC7